MPLLEWLPIVIFFISYKAADLFVATALTMFATAALLGYQKIRRKPITRMQWVSVLLLFIFGSMTLIFRDPKFLQVKPTILYLLFAAACLISNSLKKPLIGLMLREKLPLPNKAFRDLTFQWAIFFILSAAANWYVAVSFSETAWVNFKLFGQLGCWLVFTIAQLRWIGRKFPHVQGPRA